MGNVDRDRVRETTKRLDTLWQGLTTRLNSHKETLSYSVTFHQKLEQVRLRVISFLSQLSVLFVGSLLIVPSETRTG